MDIAQYYGISVHIDDSMEDLGKILAQVDSSFEPIIHSLSDRLVAGYQNKDKFKVEVLTPNRGDARYGDSLTKMPALGGIGSQALPFLDFLIRDPIRSVLLHDAGVGVVVPSPERYGVHKLIVATRRSLVGKRDKAAKDLNQAASLITALVEAKQGFELGSAWMEAWNRGPSWRWHLAAGSLRLADDTFNILEQAVVGAEHLSGSGKSHGLGSGKNGLVEIWKNTPASPVASSNPW